MRQVGRGRLAPERAVVQFHPFELADALLGAQVDAARVEQLAQHVGDHVAPVGQPERGELDREPVAVAVHDHAGEEVGLAEDDAIAGVGPVRASGCRAGGGWPREPVAEEGGVERNAFLPRVEPDVDLRLAVEEAAGDEVAAVRDEIDLVAVGRLAVDALDRPRRTPTGAARRRAGHAWLSE